MRILRSKAYVFSLIFLASASILLTIHHRRINKAATTISFSTIPLNIDGWEGMNDTFQGKNIYEFIGADVTLLRNYQKGNFLITLYIGYYPEVREGKRPHAARGCYTGQGWSITQDSFVRLPFKDTNFVMTSLLLKHNDQIQQAFYWFQNSSGEVFSNELDVNKNLFLKKVMLNNADIAFIRLSAMVQASDIEGCDKKMMEFIAKLKPYIDLSFSKRGDL